uniref:Uncharacterized protein n=1 Tax=Anguilla anguilla TaxID=7936 RepID=A0A0E9VS82_ANGAN
MRIFAPPFPPFSSFIPLPLIRFSFLSPSPIVLQASACSLSYFWIVITAQNGSGR